jgi:hypothetical protein
MVLLEGNIHKLFLLAKIYYRLECFRGWLYVLGGYLFWLRPLQLTKLENQADINDNVMCWDIFIFVLRYLWSMCGSLS